MALALDDAGANRVNGACYPTRLEVQRVVSTPVEDFDEVDEVSGDGSAELLDDDSIEIEFAYHNGDESVLKAKRDTS